MLYLPPELKFTYLAKNSMDLAADTYVHVFGMPPWNESWSHDLAKNRLLEILNIPNSINIIIQDIKELKVVGLVMGTCESWHHGRQFQIREFLIHYEWRKRGLAKILLHKLQEEVKSKGVVELYLSTSRKSEAYGFYTHHGFLESPEDALLRMQLV